MTIWMLIYILNWNIISIYFKFKYILIEILTTEKTIFSFFLKARHPLLCLIA